MINSGQFHRLLVTAFKFNQYRTDKIGEQIFNIINSHFWADQIISIETMRYGQNHKEIAF